MSDRPDFRAIKARVTMRDVLAKYGVELRKLNGSSARGKCPLPTHDPEATELTFNVDLKKSVWACHSSSCVSRRNVAKRDGGGLKKGGDVLEFVKFMEKAASLRAAGERLESWFGPFDGVVKKEAAEITDEGGWSEDTPKVNLALAFELRDIQHSHAYLQARGFDEEECEYLGVGFFPGKGSMAGRVVFPVHSEEGHLVAYVGRSIDPDCKHDERWRFPSGFFKSIELYNVHRVEGDEVIVVEGLWGVLACIRAGILNVVSVMGTSVSDVQAEMLAARFRRVILMLDGDEYGREAIASAVGKLIAAEVEHIDLVLLPKGEQPDTVTPDELRRLLHIADMPSAWSLIEELPPDTVTA